MDRNWLKYNQNNKKFWRHNRKLPTKSESLVWNMILKNKNLWYRFLRQKLIWNYIVDFYCAKLWLAIELDWDTHNYKYDEDKKREDYLKSLWLKIIRYKDDQILGNLENILEDLKYKIQELSNK